MKKIGRWVRYLAPRIVLISAGWNFLKLTWQSIQAFPFTRISLLISVPLLVAVLVVNDTRRLNKALTLSRLGKMISDRVTFVGTAIALVGVVFGVVSFAAQGEAATAFARGDAKKYMDAQLRHSYFGHQAELYRAQKSEEGAYSILRNDTDCSDTMNLERLGYMGSASLPDVDKETVVLAAEKCAQLRHDSIAVAFFDEVRHHYRFMLGRDDAMTEFEEALFQERDPVAAEMIALQGWYEKPARLRQFMHTGHTHDAIRFILDGALRTKRSLCGPAYNGFHVVIPKRCLENP